MAADAFDVVVPSIPGFGFSAEPAAGTDVVRTAELWVALMEKLGYPRFGAYGSDWGAGVTRALGARFPERLIGIHTAGTPRRVQRDPLTDEERNMSHQSTAGRSRKAGTNAYRKRSRRRSPSG